MIKQINKYTLLNKFIKIQNVYACNLFMNKYFINRITGDTNTTNDMSFMINLNEKN